MTFLETEIKMGSAKFNRSIKGHCFDICVELGIPEFEGETNILPQWYDRGRGSANIELDAEEIQLPPPPFGPQDFLMWTSIWGRGPRMETISAQTSFGKMLATLFTI